MLRGLVSYDVHSEQGGEKAHARTELSQGTKKSLEVYVVGQVAHVLNLCILVLNMSLECGNMIE
jgi:hypothetical protein